MTKDKIKRIEVKLEEFGFHHNVYTNYKSNHGVDYSKLTRYLLEVADINEEEIALYFKKLKTQAKIKLTFPKREEGEPENVINVTQRNDIVIASTPKVKVGLIKKGYTDSEITEISRYKNGDIFARDFMEYGLELPKNSTITINGIVREGETSLLRNREFSEPLRLVIKDLWNTRGIETVLITNTERYRLHSILDYTKMEYQAIQTTFRGRMAQASNRSTGLTEVLRNYLITTALTPSQAVELTVRTLKANGVWVKEKEELASYVQHFVENILIGEYELEMIAGYNMTELKEELLSAFESINLELDEKLTCKKKGCNHYRSKKNNLCSVCKQKAEELYLE